jgi:crossover junction endodeoxyribonuclease RuvC
MIVGIDPGAGGALVWMEEDGSLLAIEDMPGVVVEVGGKRRRRVSAPMLAALLRDIVPTHAYVENVGPMKTDGSAGAFAFGKSAGLIEGVLAGLSIPITLVTPQSWKRASRIPADKGAARLRAAQLFPGFASEFIRVKDDGRAEAALIALYGVQARHGVVAAA